MMCPHKRTFEKILIFLVLAFLVANCSNTYSIHQDNDLPTNGPSQTERVYIQGSVEVYHTSIKEIIDSTDLIVIGWPSNLKGILNTARDPNDPTKPDKYYFGLGQVYEVQVEDYLKGAGPKLIYVIQNQGMIHNNSIELTDEILKEAQKSSNTLPLTLNRRYVMFLSTPEHSYGDFSKEEVFIGKGHPWLFDISNPDCVRPEDASKNIDLYFPPQPYNDFLKSINSPSLNSTEEINGIYPSPQINTSKCSEIETITYPYP